MPSSPKEGNVPVLGGLAGQQGDPNPCPCLPDPIPGGSLLPARVPWGILVTSARSPGFGGAFHGCPPLLTAGGPQQLLANAHTTGIQNLAAFWGRGAAVLLSSPEMAARPQAGLADSRTEQGSCKEGSALSSPAHPFGSLVPRGVPLPFWGLQESKPIALSYEQAHK